MSAVVLSVVLVAWLAAPAVAQPPDLRAQLDAAIAAKVQEMGIPGAIVGLSIPGRIDYTAAVGVADTATAAV